MSELPSATDPGAQNILDVSSTQQVPVFAYLCPGLKSCGLYLESSWENLRLNAGVTPASWALRVYSLWVSLLVSAGFGQPLSI